jgi:hypothetical protein
MRDSREGQPPATRSPDPLQASPRRWRPHAGQQSHPEALDQAVETGERHDDGAIERRRRVAPAGVTVGFHKPPLADRGTR